MLLHYLILKWASVFSIKHKYLNILDSFFFFFWRFAGERHYQWSLVKASTKFSFKIHQIQPENSLLPLYH